MTVAAATSKIRILPEAVVSRIAAGEIVERPAAVVKELIDNSLDAGSRLVVVEVADGGRRLIRVTDDGEGMSRADAQLAFQRHATSKLRSERDLGSITSLGFRGEALPSIAAVSKVRLVTARREDPVGTRLLLAGGAVTRVEDAAAPPGTQVEVADLFFNTPARRKFLKTPATEFAHICQTVQQAALAWPQTHFKLLHNGQPVLDYPAAPSHEQRVGQVHGTKFLDQAVAVRAAGAGCSVEGFIVRAVGARTSRTLQDVFVNRRWVRNPTVLHAVYDGYGTSLAKGRHPAFVLLLEVEPDRVDVNVHPAKREVRFAEQERLHHLVRQAVREALGLAADAGPSSRGLWAPGISLAARMSDETAAPAPDGPMARAPAEALDQAAGGPPGAGSPDVRRQVALSGAGVADRARGDTVRDPTVGYAAGMEWEVVPLGQVSRTFLVAQVGPELQVIDQHTAHERVLFERLWRTWKDRVMATQPLLIPETVELPSHQAILLKDRLEDLAGLGLEVEPFGACAFVIRSTPALLGRLDVAALLQDLVEDLAQWNALSSLEARVRPVLASLACHGAVRAGRALEAAESKRLIEDWVREGLPMTCPHGRRVALRLPADELAKIFGRE
ncbi:DNA mismatch repair endonuclease MutL [Nitrospira sp. Kam-Ns4a]